MTLHIPELIRDIMDSHNYFTVSLSNADGKVLSKILAARLESSPKYYSWWVRSSADNVQLSASYLAQ